jgi:hypothetical protein
MIDRKASTTIVIPLLLIVLLVLVDDRPFDKRIEKKAQSRPSIVSRSSGLDPLGLSSGILDFI